MEVLRTNTKEKVRRIYEKTYKSRKIYENYEKFRTIVDFNTVFNFSRIKDLVLDAGCGNGRLTVPLASMGIRVIGIDFSKEGIKIANEQKKSNRIDNCDFIVADIEYLCFKDNIFDLAFFFGTLEYITNLERVLRESSRVTKSGGRILLNVWNKYGCKIRSLTLDLPHRIVDLAFKGKRANRGEKLKAHAYYAYEIRRKLTTCGYIVDKCLGLYFILPKDVLLWLMALPNSLLLRILFYFNNKISTSIIGPIISSILLIQARKHSKQVIC